MHSHAACDCYCKSRVPMADQRNEIQSDRSRVKLLTSKSFIHKTEGAIRSAKKVPSISTSARLVDQDQPATKRSTVTLPVSPVLSPETSAILEDVERLVKDAEIQIKGISIVTNCNRTQKPMKVYPNEAPLDDETDQLLYIRERVAHKFQEANGWIGADHVDIKNQGYLDGGSVPLKSMRTIDFSAPKFKSSEERYKEFSRYGKLGIEKLGASMPVDDVPETQKKSNNPNEARSSNFEAEKNKKIDTFSVQVGPSVNIQRELTAQSLGDIHISPDPSFVQESTNVGTYMVRHDCSVKPNSPTRKEKFVKILEKNESTKGSRRVTGGRQRTRNSKVLCESGSNVRSDSVHGSLSVEKSVKDAEGASDILLESNERFIENVEQLHEIETEITNLEDKENLVSTTSNDASSGHSDRRLEENPILQRPIHGSWNTKQEMESVKRGVNDSMIKASSEPRYDQKQVRFSDQILEETRLETHVDTKQNDKEAAATLEEDPKVPSESVRLDTPSTSKEIETRPENASPLYQEAEEKQRKRQKKIGKTGGYERNRRYRMIDERFSNVLKKYCSHDEKCPKNGVHFAFSSAGSSEDAEESADLDDLYHPSMNELDNVLLAYNKMINNVVRSTKTIEKFLLKPEIEEYRLQNRATTETSESYSWTPLNRSAVEATNTNVLHHLQAKRCTGPRTKDLLHKDRFLIPNKRANKELHSHKVLQTKTVKPASTKSSLRAKRDNDSRKRYVALKALGKCPPPSDPKVKERLSAPKKLLNEETTESSESTGIEAKRAREFEESRSRGSCFLRKGDDSSSLTTFSVNTLSSSADAWVQCVDEMSMVEAIPKTSNGDVAKEFTNFKPNATSMKETEVEDLQKRSFDYASLYNMVHSDVLKRGFPKWKDTPSIAEHLIARVLQEETRFIEDKIKNAFNANQIVPVLVNGLLESLQSDAINSRSQNLELLISENVSTNDDAASTNIHAVETARARSDESAKENLQIEYPSRDENFSVPETIKRDEEIIERKTCSGPISEDDVHAETINNRKSEQSSISNENVSQKIPEDLSVDGRSKIDSDVESLKDDLNTRTGEIDLDGNIQSTVQQKCRLNNDFKIQGNNNDNSSSRRNGLKLVNQENETVNAMQNVNKVKKDTNLHAENCALEAIDEPLITGKNEEDTCVSCKGSAVSNPNLSLSHDVISKVKEEEKPLRYSLSEDEAKTIAQSSHNVQQISSSDSLHNCASLWSSPRNVSKQSPNAVGSSFQINELEQFSETNNVVDGEIDGTRDQRGSYRDSVFNREKILSGLYDDVHRKLLLSTTMADQNGRLSKSVSTIGSNKIETLSDASHSEGELYMPSSGSYSLGEVRMLRKNRSDGEDTNGCDDSVTIFLTKEMLTSWNESSKSLIQSMGEI